MASHSSQPDGRIAFPPFSGKLLVDEGLKLSCENFKDLIDVFFKDKNITPLSQITATPRFPTPHVVAQFASKAYRDYKTGETDPQYEKRLALPDGWKLLMTASNSSKNNGYFGAAYCHPEHQQVVIAHRGTDLANLGALWTDLVGVVCNKYVWQMESAITFAHKVLEVLREVNRSNGVGFQLFFTGHSLGGWLAQVTTFTTKYLKREENLFLKSCNDKDCYHPHTVVFDSPGCKDMLLQMRDTFDVRHDGRSIALEHLDITSYLSAPNRINTCNSHLGTVHRIFTDLSDMGWQEKHTVLYNLATHNIDKIVQAFDPETGQVRKDEQGQLKVQVVVDWPISTGLSGGEEYKTFFEWASYLNSYHPNIKDISFQHLHYFPIRYQTKLYDERVNSFSIFSEEEQDFLQCYRWLRQWPEFFKPKELFSEVKENQAQENAEKIFQSFEIEKDTVRCADAGALQTLIPYVKRLLQLYPKTKEKIKHALSTDEVRKRVYQFETRRYVERISQSPLEFNSEPSRFREFLESEQQKVLHLRFVKGDEWTGLIKVYQVLQKTGCLIEGQYTILKLKRLLKVNHSMDLSKLMQSAVTPRLLLIACEDNHLLDEETKDVIRTIFDAIKQKTNMKIIFTTPSGGRAVVFLHHMGRRISGEGFLSRVEELTWSDLTASSQEKLLEKSVRFQDANISLKELMSAECPVADFLTLAALLEDKELKIADPVPISNGYNKSYYIGRTLRYQVAIKHEIWNDESVRYSHVYLASTEDEYTKLSQLNPKSHVHWLQKEKSGKLLWQQSQGSLTTLRRYIDTDRSPTYTADDLDKLLEQAQHQRVTLVSDTAGMGKSTVLTHLSKKIKQKFPTKWVVRIDLNDHTDALKSLKEKQIDKEKAIEFVSEKVLKLKLGLEVGLFKQCCEQTHKVRIVIMLDGFDEISPSYKDTVIDLLQALRQTAVEQLWVTTRPHLREELEDRLQQLCYTLEPFSKKDQVAFLRNFWSLKDWFTEMNNTEKEENEQKLQIYAKKLIKKLSISISDKDTELTGFPLLTRMLAEAFDKEVRIFCQSSESMSELNVNLELLELYGRFVERKYDIYQEEKLQIRASNVAGIGQRERDLKVVREEHQLLALKVVFTGKEVTLFQNIRECLFSTEDLTRIGIMQVSNDGKLQFIHHTFAEYFVADCLVNRLTEAKNTSEQVLTFILEEIFMKEYYQVIRVFMDGLLSSYNPSVEVLKQCKNRINHFGHYGEKILNRAVLEGNAKIFGYLLDSAQAAGHTEAINELLLGNEKRRETAWYLAAESGNIEVIKKIWEWAQEKLTTEEIKNKLLLCTNREGRTAWQLAAYRGKLNVTQKMWEWAEEKLTTEEIKYEMLLCTDREGRTAWHLAAYSGKLDAMKKIWEWAEKKLTREGLKNGILLHTYHLGRTAWHEAACWGELDVIQKIWEWAKEKLTTEELIGKMFLGTDDEGRTAWHLAAYWGKQDVMQKVWEWAEEKITTEEIRNEMFLRTDREGRTAWHVAAYSGELYVMQKIWGWAEEKLTTDEIKNEMLLRTDSWGRTAWHKAALRGKLDVMQKIWELAEEKLTTEEIKYEILLRTDSRGKTAWHEAALWGNLDLMQKIWELAEEKLTTEEIKNEILLRTESKRGSAWHEAAYWGNLGVMQKIWKLAEEKLTTEEIINEILLRTDRNGKTAWQLAAYSGELAVIQKIWEWAEEKLTAEEIKNGI